MQLQSAEAVAERIERAARARPRGVVATDGDGTLWSGDVGDDLFEAFLEHGRVEPAAREAILREARRFEVDDAGDAATVARRTWRAYHEGRFGEEALFEMMAWCFAGWPRGDVQRFAADVVEKRGVRARLHGELAKVLARVRAAGVEVFVVSASPIAVVHAAAALAGIDQAHVVAAVARYDAHDRMLPEVDRPIPYHGGKTHRLRERVGDRPLVAAFGDNSYDAQMLAEAEIPVAVRPKDALRAKTGEVPSMIELMVE